MFNLCGYIYVVHGLVLVDSERKTTTTATRDLEFTIEGVLR